MAARASLAEIAVPFLELGTIAFGGPAAHIAMMEEEFVRRRAWVTHEEMLDLVGAANLIPGPSSTEVALYLGYRRGGVLGLLVAGCCFILPAALVVSLLAWSYVKLGRLPQLGAAMYGVKAVVIAVVVQAIVSLGKKAIKTRWLALLGLAVVGASIAGVPPIATLIGAGVVYTFARYVRRTTVAPPTALLAAAPIVAPTKLFLAFTKIGAMVFGSGYVLLAFLRADLVQRLGWISEPTLIDAVAVGQVTPGPVFTTATFLGFVLGGWKGAVAATIGIFLPGFLLVALTARFVPRMRTSVIAASFLDGVNVAAVALMAVVTVQLARAALVDVVSVAIGLAGAVLLLRFRLNSAWIVVGGALVGVAVVLFTPSRRDVAAVCGVPVSEAASLDEQWKAIDVALEHVSTKTEKGRDLVASLRLVDDPAERLADEARKAGIAPCGLADVMSVAEARVRYRHDVIMLCGYDLASIRDDDFLSDDGRRLRDRLAALGADARAQELAKEASGVGLAGCAHARR